MITYMRLAQVRFVLMNSFSTSDDTKEHLRKKHGTLVDEPDSELVQNKSAKIDAKTLKPAEYPDHPDMEWCVAGIERISVSDCTAVMLWRPCGACPSPTM